MSFELRFENFINGIKFLELLQAWNLLEPLAVLALLMEQAANHIIFLLTWWRVLPPKVSIIIGHGCHGPANF